MVDGAAAPASSTLSSETHPCPPPFFFPTTTKKKEDEREAVRASFLPPHAEGPRRVLCHLGNRKHRPFFSRGAHLFLRGERRKEARCFFSLSSWPLLQGGCKKKKLRAALSHPLQTHQVRYVLLESMVWDRSAVTKDNLPPPHPDETTVHFLRLMAFSKWDAKLRKMYLNVENFFWRNSSLMPKSPVVLFGPLSRFNTVLQVVAPF